MAHGRRLIPRAERGPVLGRVKITFATSWQLRDATKHSGRGEALITIAPGTRILEKIKNPFGQGFWYVLPGTQIGYPDDMFHMYDGTAGGKHSLKIIQIST